MQVKAVDIRYDIATNKVLITLDKEPGEGWTGRFQTLKHGWGHLGRLNVK
jgi:hypothetical protein